MCDCEAKCDPEPTCEHPEKLKGKPGECSPEQVKECHGDAPKHECEQPKTACDDTKKCK